MQATFWEMQKHVDVLYVSYWCDNNNNAKFLWPGFQFTKNNSRIPLIFCERLWPGRQNS